MNKSDIILLSVCSLGLFFHIVCLFFHNDNPLYGIENFLSYLFSGGLLGYFISKFIIQKPVETSNKEFIKNEYEILLRILNKMESSDLMISQIWDCDKDEYSKDDVRKIITEKTNEIIHRRNIQLKQFIEDSINEIKENK